MGGRATWHERRMRPATVSSCPGRPCSSHHASSAAAPATSRSSGTLHTAHGARRGWAWHHRPARERRVARVRRHGEVGPGGFCSLRLGRGRWRGGSGRGTWRGRGSRWQRGGRGRTRPRRGAIRRTRRARTPRPTPARASPCGPRSGSGSRRAPRRRRGRRSPPRPPPPAPPPPPPRAAARACACASAAGTPRACRRRRQRPRARAANRRDSADARRRARAPDAPRDLVVVFVPLSWLEVVPALQGLVQRQRLHVQRHAAAAPRPARVSAPAPSRRGMQRGIGASRRGGDGSEEEGDVQSAVRGTRRVRLVRGEGRGVST